jgi:riboflavin biosynthesis pyrimidine reductase
MPRLIFSATCSLDGFMAGPGGDMSSLTEHLGGPNPHAERLLAGTGALLVGRRTNDGDDPNRGTDSGGAFGGQYDGPVVLTHPATRQPAVRRDLRVEHVRTRGAGKHAAGTTTYVNVLGADVGQQCLDASLLDEVLIFFAPVLLGAGTRMFTSTNRDRIDLEPATDDAVHWYRIRR